MKRYYVIRDRQCGEFGMHRLNTLKGWRETAMDWANSDDNYELYNDLKYYKIKVNELIDFISDFWDLDFKELENINEYIDFEMEYIENCQLEKIKLLDGMIYNKEITRKEKANYLMEESKND